MKNLAAIQLDHINFNNVVELTGYIVLDREKVASGLLLVKLTGAALLNDLLQLFAGILRQVLNIGLLDYSHLLLQRWMSKVPMDSTEIFGCEVGGG